MDPKPITYNYVANLLTDLTVRIADYANGLFSASLNNSNGHYALKERLYAAIVTLLAQARNMTRLEHDELEEIFTDFFQQPETIKALVPLLCGKPLDKAGLAETFASLGHSLPGLDFMNALALFEGVFIATGMDEPLPEQSGLNLSPDDLWLVRYLVKFFRKVPPESVIIALGRLKGQDVKLGRQIFAQSLSPAVVRQRRATQLVRRSYLTSSYGRGVSISTDFRMTLHSNGFREPEAKTDRSVVVNEPPIRLGV